MELIKAFFLVASFCAITFVHQVNAERDGKDLFWAARGKKAAYDDDDIGRDDWQPSRKLLLPEPLLAALVAQKRNSVDDPLLPFWAARGKKDPTTFWAARGKKGTVDRREDPLMPFWAARGKRSDQPEEEDDLTESTGIDEVNELGRRKKRNVISSGQRLPVLRNRPVRPAPAAAPAAEAFWAARGKKATNPSNSFVLSSSEPETLQASSLD